MSSKLPWSGATPRDRLRGGCYRRELNAAYFLFVVVWRIIVSKSFTAFLIVAFAVTLTVAQSSAAESAKKFSWQKCMAYETGTGLNHWSAAKRCAKLHRKRHHQ